MNKSQIPIAEIFDVRPLSISLSYQSLVKTKVQGIVVLSYYLLLSVLIRDIDDL